LSDPLDGIDMARCEALARQAAEGNAGAATALVEALWPGLQRVVRTQRSLGPLAKSDDHVHDVLAKIVEKLSAREGRSLKLYVAWRDRNPDKTLADWLRIVTKNLARDHVREHLGESRGAGPDREPSVKRLLNELASSPAWERIGVRPPMTAAQTARQLLEFAQSRLPPDQFGALTRWLDGASFEDLQSELGVANVEESRRLVRAAVAVLRRHFVHEGEPT
jgi:DNA-directed RNA polymerase specialized sigma24 family protein